MLDSFQPLASKDREIYEVDVPITIKVSRQAKIDRKGVFYPPTGYWQLK
jgi:hypothetical protein